MSDEVSPAILVAEKQSPDQIVTLSTGVRARLKAVAAGLLDEAANGVKRPRPPRFADENGREHENPDHPDYLAELEDYENKRNRAVLDVTIMLGVKLVDPIPPDDEWLDQLRFLEMRGDIDLSGYDLDKPMHREFLYKRHIAVGNDDIARIVGVTTITQEALDKAEASFRRS